MMIKRKRDHDDFLEEEKDSNEKAKKKLNNMI